MAERFLTAILFIFLFVVYYFFSFGTVEQTEVILTIATFLFATFTGFFMARQGARYSSLRQEIANFDGHMTALFRNSTRLPKTNHDMVKKAVQKHYQNVIKHGWDYPFLNKTTTLTDISAAITHKRKNVQTSEYLAMEYMTSSLQWLQVSRKAMVNLHLERIPSYQWVLIIMLGFILLLTVSAVPTTFAVIPSILKAAFGTSIVVVLIILWELNTLVFFEQDFGKRSAQDVLDITKGKK